LKTARKGETVVTQAQPNARGEWMRRRRPPSWNAWGVLPVAIGYRPATWLARQILPLARRFHLSAYDAAYLELAIREGLPLATLDDDLRRGAAGAGVALVGAP
jgi:predicted nucleic acid-binding protein